MPPKTTPNNALRRERELRGWSQGYVAEQIEAPSPSYISRWERGVTTPTPYYREKLCRLFAKNAQELGLVQIQVQEETTYEVSLTDPEPVPPTHPPLPWPTRHKWVLLGALLLIVSVLLTVSFWPHSPPTRTWPRLQRDPNVYKPAVVIMQYMLKSDGRDIGTFGVERDGIDGFYGTATDTALRAFKKAHHLPENDGVDDSTWEQLIKPSEKGNSGYQVKALQIQLNLPPNSQFDSATENAVRRFQMNHDLPVTGRADLDVWCRLVEGDLGKRGG